MKRLSVSTLILLNVAGVLMVVLGIVVPDDGTFKWLGALFWYLVYIVFGFWVMGDAASRRIPYGIGSAIMLYGCFPVFFVYYCFRSRGAGGWGLCGLGLLGFVFYAGLGIGAQFFVR